MSRTEGIVFAFSPLGKTGQAVLLAERAYAVAAAGQNLVRVGLVPNVPDNSIVGRVKDMMKSNRQFNNAQTGTQMTAGDGHRVDGLRPQFVGKLDQLFLSKVTDIGGNIDGIQ